MAKPSKRSSRPRVNEDPERAIAHTVPTKSVMARVRNADLLTQHLGRWPTFHDFEVISISLERAPYRDCTACDLRAEFYVYDLATDERPALAELLFHDVEDVKIDGFNYQNPIMGLGMRLVRQKGRRSPTIAVEWGGTLMRHDASFLCDRITVVRVMDLDPFGYRGRKS